MLKWLTKILTKNCNEIPLFWVEFNLNKYKQYGAKGSCLLKLHPELKHNDYIKDTLNNLVDYIRDNYDMEKM